MTKNTITQPMLILLLGIAFLAGCTNQGHRNNSGHGNSSGGHGSSSGGHGNSSGGHSGGGHSSGGHNSRVDEHGNVIDDDGYYPSH